MILIFLSCNFYNEFWWNIVVECFLCHDKNGLRFVISEALKFIKKKYTYLLRILIFSSFLAIHKEIVFEGTEEKLIAMGTKNFYF